MKTAALTAALSVLSLNAYALTQYTFNGTTDSTWATAGNWASSSVAPTNSTFSARRINITGASLIYSATQGTTQYNNTGTDRTFVITSGSLTITGGSFISNAITADILGNSGTASSLIVNGGSFTSNAVFFNNSNSATTNTLTVQSGTATITTLTVQGPATSTSIVNLNGGTLAVSTLTASSAGPKTLNLDGGTLKATASTLNVTGFTNAFVKSGGAVIDTNGFNPTVTQALLTDAVSTGGGLTKSGTGTLTLSGANTYTGATTINLGTLALGAADRIANSSNLVLAGGTFATGGFNETLGTLSLSASSIIDLGAGTSALVLADSSSATWGTPITLSFLNFTAGTDTVRFGTSAGGLTGTQLSQITINGFAAAIDSSGFLSIAAIPESSTYAIAAGLGALVFTAGIRRRRSARTSS